MNLLANIIRILVPKTSSRVSIFTLLFLIAITFTTVSTAMAYTDVQVIDFWPVTPLEALEDCTIRTQLHNYGDSGDYVYEIYVDDYWIVGWDGYINAGETVYYYDVIPGSYLDEGTHKIYVWADGDRTEWWTWTGTPDLELTDIYDPTSLEGGEESIIEAELTNIGTGNADPSTLILYVDDASVASWNIPSLDAWTYIRPYIPFPAGFFLAGEHSFRFVADYYDDVDESDETNNERTESWTWTGTPDLEITHIYDPTSLEGGEESIIKARLANAGYADAVGPFTLALYVDDVNVTNWNIPSLSARTYIEPYATASGGFVAGEHSFRFVADSDDDIAESDETNNERTKSWTWTGTPDLEITDIFDPTSLVAYEGSTVGFQLNNIGYDTTGVPFYVDLYVDGVNIYYWEIPAFPARTYINLTAPFDMGFTPGGHSFEFIADSYNEVTESDETNNERTESFTWTEPTTIPDIPALISPANGVNVPGTMIPFDWEHADRANDYWIQVSTDSGFTQVVFDDAIGPYLWVDLYDFGDDGQSYWWRVSAGNSIGWSNWSSVWTFVNGESLIPDPPVLYLPENNAAVGGTAVDFWWFQSDGADDYWLQISIDSGFASVVYDEAIGDFTGITLGGFSDDGRQYWWRVSAGNWLGWSSWSSVRSFINADSVPIPPTLLSPSDGSDVDGEIILFRWTLSSGADDYYLQVASDAAFSSIFYEGSAGNWDWKLVVGFPQDGTQYWWHVKAGNDSGWSGYSSAFNFFNTDGNDYVEGNVSGMVFPENGDDPLTARDISHETVTLDKGGGVFVEGETNISGYYLISDSGNDVIFELKGPYCRAINEDTAEAIAQYPMATQVDHLWNYGLVDTHLDEVNVFYHVNFIHDFFKNDMGYNSPNRYGGIGMDYQMQANVHVGTNFGNAYYDSSDQSIHFGDGDLQGNVIKPARGSDVIYHEYTHGVNDHIYDLPYLLQPGTMDEGLADYFACSVTGDPIIGEYVLPYGARDIAQNVHEMRFDDQGIRNKISDPEPPNDYWILGPGVVPNGNSRDPNYNDLGWVHHNSVVYSGALWDFRQMPGVGKAVADKVIFRHIHDGKPFNFLESLYEMLETDDNPALGFGGDGNVGNGTPHETQIILAFARHGIYDNDDSYEDNDTLADAHELSSGSYNNLKSYDSDWYKVNLNVGDTLTATINNFTNAYGDLDLYLYDPSQTQIDSSETTNDSETVSVSSVPISGFYFIEVRGYNGATNYYNLSISVAGTADTTPPIPNPMTWETEPSALTSSSIEMTATTAVDIGSPPVAYYFESTSGNSSSWQSSSSYSDSGLNPNTLYDYKVKARDSASVPNETGYSGMIEVYTVAETPGSPIVDNPTPSSLDVDIVPGLNPPNTEYAIHNVTFDYYLDAAGGDNGSTEVWQTESTWGVVTATGLSARTLYSFRVKARNGDAVETGLGSSGTGTTTNTPPSITGVTITPDPAYTNNDLTATPSGWDDADGDAEGYQYQWQKFIGSWQDISGATTATLASSNFVKGDQIKIICIPYDGYDPGEAKEDTITISNTPPSITSVTITPDPAYPNNDLTATPSGWSDIDGDSPGYQYQWQKNGSPISGATTNTLASTNFVEGDQIKIICTPYDGYDPGVAREDTITISSASNTPPSITSVTISPDPAYTNNNLTATPSGWYDAEGDPEGYLYQWYKNGSPISGATTDTLASSNFVKGDQIKVICTPHDGKDPGEAKEDTVTISNTPPLITSVTITPDPAYPNNDLTATPSGWYDADGDSPDYAYQWYKNGALLSGATTNTLSCTTYNIGEDDEFRIVCIPYDGYNYGVSKEDIVTISTGLVSPADFDQDGNVDFADFATFTAAWLSQPGDPNWDARCDFNDDGIVNFLDYAVFANEWNPSSPSGLTAQAVSATQIDLTWQDNSDGEDGFKIERKTGAEGTYEQIADVGPNVTTYSDTGLTPGQIYYYRVYAFGGFGNSGYSNEASAVAASPADFDQDGDVDFADFAVFIAAWLSQPGDPNWDARCDFNGDGIVNFMDYAVFANEWGPLSPSGLTAQAVSATQIDLTWQDNSDGEDGFKIERKTGAEGTYEQIASVGENVVTYSDTGLETGQTYYYRVYAYGDFGSSGYSNEASAVAVSPADFDQDGDVDFADFEVFIAAWLSQPGDPHWDARCDFNGDGIVNFLDYAVFANEWNPHPPEPLSAQAVSSSQIDLTWQDNSDGEDGFKIERKTGAGGTYEQIASIGPDEVTYSDTGLEAGQMYYYQMYAFGNFDNSGYSNEANATTITNIWYVDDSAGYFQDGTSWADAFHYLQDALNNPYLEPGHEIRVAQGTYKPDRDTANQSGTGDRTATFQLIDSVTIKGGYGGIDTGDHDERDIVFYETILSGNIREPIYDDDNSYHVITGSNTNPTAILDGFTITEGKAFYVGASPTDDEVRGAGMFNNNGNPTVKNCIFKNNDAFSKGGGVYNFESSPEFTNCIFIGNEAIYLGSGGAIYNHTSSPKFTSCIFNDNWSKAEGGAIYNRNSSSPEITNCTFTENKSEFYAGIIYNSNSNPVITNSILRNGGINEIFNSGTSNPVVTYSNIAGSNPNGYPGEGNINSNPLFVDPDNPLQDGLRLAEGSPCIDAANDTIAPSTDKLGKGRVDIPGVGNDGGIGADMGAYEYVEPNVWYVDAAQTNPDRDGTSWYSAFKYLQDALNHSEIQPYDEIWVAHGTHKPHEADFFDPSPPGIYRGPTFQLRSRLTVKGGYAGYYDTPPGANEDDRDIANYQTILSGDTDGNDGNPPDFSNYTDNSTHVVRGIGANPTAILDGVIITGGNATGGYDASFGGGLCNAYGGTGNPTITNCVFSYNRADYGGGIYGEATLKNCIFDHNVGGAIHGGSLEVINSVFTHNTDVAIYGDGKITNCTFYGNIGYGVVSNNATITNCVLWNNSGDEIYEDPYLPSNTVVSYSNVEGGYPGDYNIDSDPLFVNVSSPAGNDGLFCTLDDGLQLSENSPCLDVADDIIAPSTDILGQERMDIPDTGFALADMGAYEARAPIFISSPQILDQPYTNYYLTRDLLGEEVIPKCIWIQAEGIVFDGQGYSIINPYLEDIIVFCEADNIVIRNCNLTASSALSSSNNGRGQGIYSTGNNCLIEGNTVSDTFWGIHVIGEGTVIRNNLLERNAKGIHLGGNNHLVRDNLARYNNRYQGWGMGVWRGKYNQFINNEIHGNRYGIVLYEADHTHLEDDQYYSNSVRDIYLYGNTQDVNAYGITYSTIYISSGAEFNEYP